jgi:hypothetical protein
MYQGRRRIQPGFGPEKTKPIYPLGIKACPERSRMGQTATELDALSHCILDKAFKVEL